MTRGYYQGTVPDQYDYMLLADALREGYIPYAGPYRPLTENWMIRRAVADILANARDKYTLVKKGSQVEIYIIPNFYLMTFTGRPYTYHGDDDLTENDGDISGLAESQTEESLPGIASTEQNESQLAQEVFEGEGGTPAATENTEGSQLV